MDIVLVYELNVLAFTCISFKNLDIVILYLGRLGYNIIVLVSYALIEKVLPLIIREMIVIEFFQLVSEVEDKVSLLMDEKGIWLVEAVSKLSKHPKKEIAATPAPQGA